MVSVAVGESIQRLGMWHGTCLSFLSREERKMDKDDQNQKREEVT